VYGDARGREVQIEDVIFAGGSSDPEARCRHCRWRIRGHQEGPEKSAVLVALDTLWRANVRQVDRARARALSFPPPSLSLSRVKYMENFIIFFWVNFRYFFTKLILRRLKGGVRA
jgi:hypothetical protein